MVIDGLTWPGHLNVVRGLEITLNDNNRANNLLRLEVLFVVRENRDVQQVPFHGILRNSGGDFTSVLVNKDSPSLAILACEGGLGGAILEGVPHWSFVSSISAQPPLRNFGRKTDIRVWLPRHRVIVRDLDICDRLELDLDLIRGLVRVGGLHLRGDDRTRRNGLVRLRSDLAGLINCDGPAGWNGGWVDLELGWVDRLVALHDGPSAHLGRDFLVEFALGQARAYQVSYLRVVRINNYHKL